MNNLTVTTDHIFMGNYKNRDNITDDIGEIILLAQQIAYRAADAILV